MLVKNKMKYLKTYNEISSYLDLHGDGYEITQVKRDAGHDYKFCDGVLYQLSGRKDIVVDIVDVEHTDENVFYQDQIERYEEYISDGGIIETFPVSVIAKCDNLEEMLSYIDDEKDGFDIAWSLFKDKNDKIYNIYMKKGFCDISVSPEEYGFTEEHAPTKKNKRGWTELDLTQIKTISDLEEAYYDFSDEEPIREDYDNDDYNDEFEEWKEKYDKYDKDILDGLIDIMRYFEDENTYSLLDFNHRFAALVNLGKKRVYVEIT